MNMDLLQQDVNDMMFNDTLNLDEIEKLAKELTQKEAEYK